MIYANRIGLTIGLPFSGNPLVPEFAIALSNLHPPMNFNLRFNVIMGRPVDEARNYLAKCAINDGAKYLFFVDEDVTPPAHAIRQLVLHLEHYPKAMVAGGIYCHKGQPNFPMVFRGNGAGPYWNWKLGEVFQCSGLGMGCALINTEVFKHIPEPWFKTIDSIDDFMDGKPQAEAWTEDIYFCDQVTKAGFDIFADGGLTPNHWDARTHRAYNLPPNSYPLLLTKHPAGKKKIVDLGCGMLENVYRTDEGPVLRVDIDETYNPDYRCDLRALPFANQEFDIVFSSHTLEHFPRTDVESVLKEWIRILKDDGELRLVLPNMEWAAQHIAQGHVNMDVMNVLYGGQDSEYNYHYMGFTPKMVEQLLAGMGFTKFIWSHVDFHMFLRAWRGEPKELYEIPNPTIRRTFDGIVAETDNKPLWLTIPTQPEEKKDETPSNPLVATSAVSTGGNAGTDSTGASTPQ